MRPKFIHVRILKDEMCIPKLVKSDEMVKHVVSEIDSLREECVKKEHEESKTISKNVPFESEEQTEYLV